MGNIPGEGGEDTSCWKCKKALVRRAGFFVVENSIKKGTCAYCGAVIDGMWG
jgi:pyruvate formate lyase activating enzyme